MVFWSPRPSPARPTVNAGHRQPVGFSKSCRLVGSCIPATPFGEYLDPPGQGLQGGTLETSPGTVASGWTPDTGVDQIRIFEHQERTVDTPYKLIVHQNPFLLHSAQHKWLLAYPQRVTPIVSLSGPNMIGRLEGDSA